MKIKTALFLNPNQLILVREMQKSALLLLSEFSPVPTLPLCVTCAELHSLSDKITKATPTELFFERTSLFLSVELEINGKSCKGTIELCKILSERDCTPEEKRAEIQEACATPLSKIKKISPFRIVELESEEYENGRTWRVLGEKWGKIPPKKILKQRAVQDFHDIICL